MRRKCQRTKMYNLFSREENNKEIFQENQAGLLHHLETHCPRMVKQEMISDPFQRTSFYRHHVELRVKLYSSGKESFPVPVKCIDVSRTTQTNFDVKQERRIDDCWNFDGSRDLSDPWTGFTQFTLLEEKPPNGYMWSGGINEKTIDIQVRLLMARTLDEIGKKCPAEGEAKVVT